jgi:hypothetical protein
MDCDGDLAAVRMPPDSVAPTFMTKLRPPAFPKKREDVL